MRFLSQNTIQSLNKPNLLRVFKALFFCLLIALLFQQVSKLKLNQSFIRQLWSLFDFKYFALAVGLVIPNYFLEIWKWKLLANQIENRNFNSAKREVLRGLRLGLVTPFMLGDYVGRSISFQKQNRYSAAALNLFNSFTQSWTSLLFGGVALFLLSHSTVLKHTEVVNIFSYLLLITSLIGLVVLLGAKPTFSEKFTNFKSPNLDFALKLKILALSLLRTGIYNFQYVLFYKAFGILLSSTVYFIGVNILLLVKTIGGGLNIIGDLTLREIVSINFFEMYGVDQRLVLIATFTVWFFNVFLPATISLIYKSKA